MKAPVAGWRLGVYCSITAGLLAACAVPPEPVDTRPAEVLQAERASDAGSHAIAAALWEEAAGFSGDPERQGYLLRAAEDWFRAQRNAESDRVLRSIDDQLLAGAEFSRYALLRAELALASADADQADFFLEIASAGLPESQADRYRELASRVAQLRANPSSYALALASNALSSMGPYTTASGVALLQTLEDARSGILEEGAAGTSGIGAWLDLALRIRRALISGSDLRAAAIQWAIDYPGHAVDEAAFAELGTEYGRKFSPPLQVAVLLPTEGNLAAAGSAIRDGLLSSYFARPHRSTLSFHATDEDPQSAISAYFQAMREGADWIIGPLRREAVQALAGLGGLGVPALVLNSVRDPATLPEQNLLFSLSLSQEDEARSVARKAVETGHTRALTLVADNTWGARVEAAFLNEFQIRAGRVVATSQFRPAESDHGALLTRLLEIDQSHDRKNRLQATLGVELAFEPTRRDDFDLIFLAATPEQGRQLKPQLRFHDAGDKAVFAMGRIYSGETDRTADQDLNGIFFPTTDWRRPAGGADPGAELQSLRGGSLGNLYALGADAWDLITWLPLMLKDPDLAYPGAVGALRMSASGQLVREPVWAVFDGGRAEPVSWPPPED